MAFFGSDDHASTTQYINPNTSNNQALTTIAQGATIEGTLKFHSRLQIDGAITGTITSTNEVSIGKSGFFEGELTAKKLIVSGIFSGVAECDIVEIAKDGQFKGKVIAKDLIIQSLALFEGESVIKKDPPTPTKTAKEETKPSATV